MSQRGFHQTYKQRVRLVRTALELRMELYAYKIVVLGYLNRLHYPAVGRCSAQLEPCICQNLAIVVVELVAVAVSLADVLLAVAFANHCAFRKPARICAQTKRSALADAARLVGEKVYDLIPANV